MGKSTKGSDNTAQVTELIGKLEPGVAEVVERIRKVILSTDKEIGEQVKWNSPSYWYTGEMKPFDPKEYKRDIVVLNLHRGNILLVFPTGVVVNDTTGFLEGDYKDGRRIARINDMADLETKEQALKQVIKAWLELVDR